MRWGMQREEKKHVEKERATSERDILEWRNDQRIQMQAYVQEIFHQRRAQELLEKRELGDFRREAREQEEQEELRRVAEEYLSNADYANWMEDVGKIQESERQDLLEHRAQYRIEVREILASERKAEKMRSEEDRAIERSLEMTHQVNQMSKEKADILRNLQMMQSRQKGLLGSRTPRSEHRSGFR